MHLKKRQNKCNFFKAFFAPKFNKKGCLKNYFFFCSFELFFCSFELFLCFSIILLKPFFVCLNYFYVHLNYFLLISTIFFVHLNFFCSFKLFFCSFALFLRVIFELLWINSSNKQYSSNEQKNIWNEHETKLFELSVVWTTHGYTRAV